MFDAYMVGRLLNVALEVINPFASIIIFCPAVNADIARVLVKYGLVPSLTSVVVNPETDTVPVKVSYEIPVPD